MIVVILYYFHFCIFLDYHIIANCGLLSNFTARIVGWYVATIDGKDHNFSKLAGEYCLEARACFMSF